MPDNEKRPRGRPRGSSRKQKRDMAMLRQVADMMTADPTLTKTSAINQVIAREGLAPHDTSKKTVLRRLQGKFTTEGVALLAEAKTKRTRARQNAAREDGYWRMAQAVASAAPPPDAIAALASVRVPPEVMETLRELNSHYAEFQSMIDGPAMREAARMLADQERAVRAAGIDLTERFREMAATHEAMKNMFRDLDLGS